MIEKDLIIIGGGGHAKSCIDVIEACPEFNIKGILDVEEKLHSTLLGYPFIGTDSDIEQFVNDGCWFIIAVGQIKSAVIREAVWNNLRRLKARIATVVSPLANVSRHSIVGEGTIVMHGAKVNAGAKIGVNCIINTNANVEHDTIVGSHSHISTGVLLNGNCTIAERVFIGSGAIVVQGVEICSNVIVGAGSVVNKKIDKEGTYVGNPSARIG